MSIDIRLLRYFSVVAEELSISRAAVRLHMSQPPLSQQIQQLEDRLGVVLLLRKKRGIELTAAGAAMAAEAKLVIARLEQAVDAVKQIGRGELGHIRIGVISSAMWGEFPNLLRRFHTSHPGVNWSVKEQMPSVQVQSLLERRIDIGFFRSVAQAPEGCRSVRVAPEEFGAVVHARHLLARRMSIPLSSLADADFVMLDTPAAADTLYLAQCCVDAGFTPRVIRTAIEPQTLVALVSAGMGVTLLPWSMSRIGWPDVKFLRIRPPTPTADLYAVYREEELSPVVQQMVSMITAR
ncbi:LysR family transcriptional regulator [Ideonella sp. A 288]|uniref:LysR family transcriptional regulator n=1 Tax=Ideonella sp. A 288 TaxID=1962181 RepID=UPI0013035F6B|nr:LysR family transcriptional regulator [Ideonella sp. A 288]